MLGEVVDGFDAERAVEALGDVRVVRGFIDRYEASVTSRLGDLHDAGASAPAVDLQITHGPDHRFPGRSGPEPAATKRNGAGHLVFDRGHCGTRTRCSPGSRPMGVPA